MDIYILISEFISDQMITNIVDAHDINITEEIYEDDSEFVFIDGEEGDYGNIYYYRKSDNVKLASEINRGGDSIEWEFTKEFINIVEKDILKAITKNISKRFNDNAY